MTDVTIFNKKTAGNINWLDIIFAIISAQIIKLTLYLQK